MTDSQFLEQIYLDLIDLGYTPARAGRFRTLYTRLLNSSLSSPTVGKASIQYNCLEPLAILPTICDVLFPYNVPSTKTLYLLDCWGCGLGSAGRYEARTPQPPIPLRNITIADVTGDGTATAYLLDPTLVPIPDNPVNALNDRLAALDNLDTKIISWESAGSVTGDSVDKRFIPGPYGSIIRGFGQTDCAWMALRPTFTAPQGMSGFHTEIDDTSSLRAGGAVLFPVNKHQFTTARLKFGTPPAGGSSTQKANLIYNVLPANWSNIPDPISKSYIFRDDFLGASLDTVNSWTKTESTAGNVAIDSNFGWLKLKGNGSHGANGVQSKTAYTRSQGYSYVFDVNVVNQAVDPGSSVELVYVGLTTGASLSYVDFAHVVYFDPNGTLYIIENNNFRLTGTYTSGSFRIRITPQANGSATYEMQGMPIPETVPANMPAIGSANWLLLAPSGSSSPTNTFYLGATGHSGTTYVGDIKVYKP